jgi:methylated-DNA-[protein]-cysteine S-methyltransferase
VTAKRGAGAAVDALTAKRGAGAAVDAQAAGSADAAVEALNAACSADAAELVLLQAKLAEHADAQELLDVSIHTVDSPFGPLLLAATPRGLVRTAFALEDHDTVVAALAVAISPRILRSSRRTDAVARQLDEYFAGTRRAFEVPLDLQLVRGFRRAVVTHLAEIPYGSTETYAVVAEAAGSPAAVRAAGSACRHNPLPVVVPCHRVVRSDGTLGQYLGGVEVKRALLALEGAA